MIKANELRIGNWVRYKRSDEYYYRNYFIAAIDVSNDDNVIAILENGNDFYRMSYENNGDLQPVLLTKEILSSFENYDKFLGFKIQPNDYPNGDLFIDFINEEDCYLQNCADGYKFGQPIKYVHQLQNIYFLLKGFELQVVIK